MLVLWSGVVREGFYACAVILAGWVWSTCGPCPAARCCLICVCMYVCFEGGLGEKFSERIPVFRANLTRTFLTGLSPISTRNQRFGYSKIRAQTLHIFAELRSSSLNVKSQKSEAKVALYISFRLSARLVQTWRGQAHCFYELVT